MSNDEVRFIASLQSGFKELIEVTRVARADLLAQLVAKNLPPARPNPDLSALTEDERAMATKLWKRASGAPLRLMDASVVARELGSALPEAFARVREVAGKLSITLDFGDADIESVVAFSDVHWVVAEGSGFLGQAQPIEPSHAFEMARRLSSRRYLLLRHEANQILELAKHVHRVFGWPPPPLTLEQIQSVLALEPDAARVLEKLTAPGKVRIGKILVIALELGKTFSEIAKHIRVLSILDVEGPADEETYLGIPWQSLAEPEPEPNESRSPHGAEK
jgi:hypothetical protein